MEGIKKVAGRQCGHGHCFSSHSIFFPPLFLVAEGRHAFMGIAMLLDTAGEWVRGAGESKENEQRDVATGNKTGRKKATLPLSWAEISCCSPSSHSHVKGLPHHLDDVVRVCDEGNVRAESGGSRRDEPRCFLPSFCTSIHMYTHKNMGMSIEMRLFRD